MRLHCLPIVIQCYAKVNELARSSPSYTNTHGGFTFSMEVNVWLKQRTSELEREKTSKERSRATTWFSLWLQTSSKYNVNQLQDGRRFFLMNVLKHRHATVKISNEGHPAIGVTKPNIVSKKPHIKSLEFLQDTRIHAILQTNLQAVTKTSWWSKVQLSLHD